MPYSSVLCTMFMVFAAITVDVYGECPYIKGCQFNSDDCTSLTCRSSFMGKDISFSTKLNMCQTDITATVSITALGRTFSHTFASKQDVPIPSLDFGPLGKVYFRFEMIRESDKNLHLKVSLALKLFSFGKSVTIIDDNLGQMRKGMECGFLAWVGDQPIGIQAAIYGGFAAVVLSIIGCICCCCCCCRKRRSPGAVIVQSHQMQPAGELPENKGTEYVQF